MEANNGRKQVFSMVGAQTTKDTIVLARHAEAAGADGIGVVTPSYFRLDQEELLSYYQDISASVSEDFSIYLYGIPQLAVNDITPELAERIVQTCPNVAGIKYSYPDMPRLLKFLDVRGGDFSVLAGSDDLFFSLLASGGDGTISVNSNVIPEHFVAIYQAYKAGDYNKASRLQAKTNRLIAYIGDPNNMSRYKIGPKERGIIKCAAVRKPLRSLTPEEEHEFLEQIKSMDYLDITKY